MSKRLTIFSVLACTQIVGWGVVGLLPVVAAEIAADLAMPLPTVFLGTSVMFLAMGLVAPGVGRGFARFGARRVMAAGAALTGGGLALMALAAGAPVFLLAWAVIGVAGAMFLTTAAYVYLSDLAGEGARGLIGTLMLATGLAGSLFWPVTAVLDQAIGWRGAAFTFAGLMLLGVCPLLLLALPETPRQPRDQRAVAGDARRTRVFWLIVAAVALNGFVTFGFESVGIELFRALGADAALAVGVASAMGVFKVAGRLVDLAGGRRWSSLGTALVSGAMLPVGLAALMLGGGSLTSVVLCLLFYGIGSGAFAVARATMPLVFYRKDDYAQAMSTIALPLNLTNALAPPCLAALLTGPGPEALLVLLAGLSGLAFLVLLQLKRHHDTYRTPGLV